MLSYASMLRLATVEDEPFLRLMMGEATHRPGSLPEVLADPRNARYVDGWGRSGDLGVIAEENGRTVGAAWLRRLAGDEVRPGYDGPPVARLVIAVAGEHRGQGHGHTLLERLLAEAEHAGLREVQLSVGVANTPAVRLYERMGFSVVATDGQSALMVRRLRPD